MEDHFAQWEPCEVPGDLHRGAGDVEDRGGRKVHLNGLNRFSGKPRVRDAFRMFQVQLPVVKKLVLGYPCSMGCSC